jgi:gliding motility-associated-like protein
MAEVTATGGTAPYAYAWSDGQTAGIASGLSAGIHTVTVTDANGCQDTAGITISQPEEILIQETITQPFCPDSYDGVIEISVSGGTPPLTVTWTDGSMGLILENLGPGAKEVRVTDLNQCTVSETYTLAPDRDNCVTVFEIITPNGDGYNDTWRIRGIEYYPAATVEVYDRWGKQVFFSRGYDTEWDGTYDGKTLPMASYHFVVNLGDGSPAIVGNITIMK